MRDKRKRFIFIACTVIVMLLSIFWGCNFYLREGVYVGEDFYYKVSDEKYQLNHDNYIILNKQNNIGTASIVFNGEEQTAELTWDNDKVQITFSDGTIINGEWFSDCFWCSQNDPLSISPDQFIITINNESVEISKEALSDILCRINMNKTESKSSFSYMIFSGAIIYMLGMLFILFPEKAAYFLTRWRYRNPELTDEGKIVEQIAGVVFLVIGVTAMTGTIISFLPM